MTELQHGPLGQKSEYPEHYAPQVLYPIPRAAGRAEIQVAAQWPWAGEDVWNGYELSWLMPGGKPRVALVELRVPAHSPNIVESKSLKLYLGSFNQTVFDSATAVESTIAKDVSAVVGAEVTVQVLDFASTAFTHITDLPGHCIDDEGIAVSHYTVAPELLCVQEDCGVVSETLHSHLLRSNCPVTGQPDWASVMVQYRGKPIDRAALLHYVVSYRTNQEFHEQCVERIFTDILQRCQPDRLTVYARYTRRGGIDINPWRSTDAEHAPNWRLVRQ